MNHLLNLVRIVMGMMIASFGLPGIAQSSSHAHTETIRQVTDYINQMTTLQADFIQTNSDGGSLEGKVAIHMPYRVKLEYNNFTLLAVDSSTLIYFDLLSQRKTFFSLKDVPLGILMNRPFVLDHSVDVLNIHHGQGIIRLTLARPKAHDRGTLTLIFNTYPFQLRGWEIVDAQRLTTSISLFNVQEHIFLEPSVFKLPKTSRR